MSNPTPSNDLRIKTPCPKTWSELEGDERSRFCSACSLHVHNSEALTRAAANELAADRASRVCMRIVQDESGSPVFLDSVAPAKSAPSRFNRVARWALATGAGLLAACRADTSSPPVDPHPSEGPTNGEFRATLGEVCPPENPGEPRVEELIGDVAAPGESCEEPSAQVHETLGRISFRQPNPPTEEPK